MKIIKIGITDMDCAMCAKTIETAFDEQPGIVSAVVNLSEGNIRIKYDELRWNEKSLYERIRLSGYTPHKISEKKKLSWTLLRMIISIILSLPLVWTMLAHAGFPQDWVDVLVPDLLMNPFFQLALATPIQFGIGLVFYKRAYYDLKNKSIGMDVLVALATTIAYFYSAYIVIRNFESIAMMGHYEGLLYFEASSVIITVILIGHYLEHKVKNRTSQSLNELMELSVKEAVVLVEGEEKLLPLDFIKINDILLVRKGEKIPLDGEIIEGQTVIDESMITGESIPVSRGLHEEVIGATINLGTTIKVRVSKPLDETLLQQIVKAVEDAQAQKPKIQKIADRIASIFVPVVILISIAAFITHYLWLNPGEFDPSFSAAIAVLVISCPCALGLATPMSIMVGSSLAARHGILYRSGAVFEKTTTIDAVAFDKTGTLTEGKPEVTEVDGTGFEILVGLEEASTHPLSIAVRNYAKKKNINAIKLENITEEAGSGLSGIFQDKQYFAGSLTYISKMVTPNKNQLKTLDKFHSEGKTVVFLASKEKVLALVAIKDKMKSSAQASITRLHDMGIKTYLISGDHLDVALGLAREVGIEDSHVFAGVSPFQKADIIKKLQTEGKKVAFVGDGINDAVALKQADLSMAMGNGSSVAIETSDVTLLHQDLLAVAHTIEISKATIKNIKLGFLWAFSYNLFAIPIAFMGTLSPVVAASAMAVSDITVVLNALRLRGLKLNGKKEKKNV